MGLRTVQIAGGDQAGTNTNAGSWAAATQVAAVPLKLHKLVVFVPTAIGANRVIWLLDVAAGDNTAKDPIPLLCPPGYTTTLDFGDGGLQFSNGLYIVVCTNEPAGPTTAQVVGAANDARVEVNYRLKF
jgi:hypothetical protein